MCQTPANDDGAQLNVDFLKAKGRDKMFCAETFCPIAGLPRGHRDPGATDKMACAGAVKPGVPMEADRRAYHA